jgi:hypothetical protein
MCLRRGGGGGGAAARQAVTMRGGKRAGSGYRGEIGRPKSSRDLAVCMHVVAVTVSMGSWVGQAALGHLGGEALGCHTVAAISRSTCGCGGEGGAAACGRQ